jgi:DNA-binding GntR family transcriptional regulator
LVQSLQFEAQSSQRESKGPGIPARIADQIRELIVRGAIAPGVHLGQMDLAQRFSASRVPVREALKLLAAEGLLIHDPNRGFFVTLLSSEEARQLYRLRHLIEAELLETLTWPTTEQVTDLEAPIEELERLLEAGKRLEWSVAHREFHRAVFDLSPEKVLVREIIRLWMLTDRYRSLLPTPQRDSNGGGAQDERDLLDALVVKDRERLLDVFEKDRTQVERMLLTLLREREL